MDLIRSPRTAEPPMVEQTGRQSPDLSVPVREWPYSAKSAYLDVLRALNEWSRDNGWPDRLNGDLAAEAVNRAWNPPVSVPRRRD